MENAIKFLYFVGIFASVIYIFGQCHQDQMYIMFNKNRIVDGYSQLICDSNNSSIVKLSCNKVCNQWFCDYNDENTVLSDIRVYYNTSWRMVYKLNKKIAKKTV